MKPENIMKALNSLQISPPPPTLAPWLSHIFHA